MPARLPGRIDPIWFASPAACGVSVEFCAIAAYYCAIINILHGFCHLGLPLDQILQCFIALAVYASGFHLTATPTHRHPELNE